MVQKPLERLAVESLPQSQAVADVSIATFTNVWPFGVEVLFIFVCVCVCLHCHLIDSFPGSTLFHWSVMSFQGPNISQEENFVINDRPANIAKLEPHENNQLYGTKSKQQL